VSAGEPDLLPYVCVVITIIVGWVILHFLIRYVTTDQGVH